MTFLEPQAYQFTLQVRTSDYSAQEYSVSGCIHDMSTEMLANKMVDCGCFASAVNSETVVLLLQRENPVSSTEALFHRIAKENHLSLRQESEHEIPSFHQFCTDLSTVLTNSSVHCDMDPTTSLSGAPLLSIRSTLLLSSHLGDMLISFDYWVESQSSILKQRCFVDSLK